MKVRIGIDVGGTFTDAAVIDNDTYELVGTAKIPTTHTAETGVAAGIIEVLRQVMERYAIKPEDVVFIAHGTTQATNALLEGDVVKVGIVTLGTGLEGAKAKSDTVMGKIALTATKGLDTSNRYLDSRAADLDALVAGAVGELRDEGCGAVVAAEAFSVDDPENEYRVVDLSRSEGVAATATAEISKLYGLKVRTRTAVVNSSIMPRMLDAANMTSRSIAEAGIRANLMVMRCDGGVMTIDEVRKRPILTILSGPAAGVAGALMYEKLTDGIFFEVGGTSTDISCVKDGTVMVKYAQIGGHSTFLTSLDVRTVGIGGGSMIQLEKGGIVDAGPRSAHIAGLRYEVYADPAEIVDPALKAVRPVASDPDYAYVECAGGKTFALTLSGAANIAGLVAEGDYAGGNVEAARRAWKPLADGMGITVEQAAEKALQCAALKNGKVAEELIRDYKMDPRTTIFVGGGGGASVVVPHLAGTMGHKWKNARNAPVISTIGVALALVRDMVERTILNPTEQDLLSVRREAEAKAVQAGANPDTVEVSVEVDTQKNVVRAIAIGTTEMRSKDLGKEKLGPEALCRIVAENLQVTDSDVKVGPNNGQMYAILHDKVEKRLFGLMSKTHRHLRLIDDEGVIRLQKSDAKVRLAGGSDWEKALAALVDDNADFSDGGEQLPNTYIVSGKRIINLSGLSSQKQIMSMAKIELAAVQPDESLILICSDRMD